MVPFRLLVCSLLETTSWKLLGDTRVLRSLMVWFPMTLTVNWVLLLYFQYRWHPRSFLYGENVLLSVVRCSRRLRRWELPSKSLDFFFLAPHPSWNKTVLPSNDVSLTSLGGPLYSRKLLRPNECCILGSFQVFDTLELGPLQVGVWDVVVYYSCLPLKQNKIF